MFRPPHAVALVLALGLILCASAALAFIDPPTLAPANPVAGQTVSVSIRAGGCDFFIERAGYPQITQTGQSIRIVLASIHATSSQFCIPQPSTLVTPVGAYPAGSYTLQVDRVYADDQGQDVVETIATLPFVVGMTAAGATSVPAQSPFFIVLLIVA
ncbi:MAG TPA: hypothetical protein VFN09_09100, partial [Rhodanobacteraceae bacterium]|nr:hypothetical protein [Rhodanobacteraceae bacterium]